MDDSRVGPKVDIAFRKATKKFHSKGQTEEEGEDAREEPEQTIHEFDDRDDDKTDEFGVDPTQKGRGPKSERRHKRRPDMKLFDPQPVVELLRGRYRAVMREMRQTGPSVSRFVHQYEADDDTPPERDVDFESLMGKALHDFAEQEKKVDADFSPT